MVSARYRKSELVSACSVFVSLVSECTSWGGSGRNVPEQWLILDSTDSLCAGEGLLV